VEQTESASAKGTSFVTASNREGWGSLSRSGAQVGQPTSVSATKGWASPRRCFSCRLERNKCRKWRERDHSSWRNHRHWNQRDAASPSTLYQGEHGHAEQFRMPFCREHRLRLHGGLGKLCRCCSSVNRGLGFCSDSRRRQRQHHESTLFSWGFHLPDNFWHWLRPGEGRCGNGLHRSHRRGYRNHECGRISGSSLDHAVLGSRIVMARLLPSQSCKTQIPEFSWSPCRSVQRIGGYPRHCRRKSAAPFSFQFP
jgi:hypothetical protein